MSEPTTSLAEPAVIGPEVAADETLTTEPVETNNVEPDQEESTTDTDDQSTESDESFMDLKTVPKELEGAAKKMQAEYTKKMQALATSRRAEQLDPTKTAPPPEDGSTDPDRAEIQQFLKTPQGSALKSLLMEEMASELGIGDIKQRVYTSEADKEVAQVTQKYGEEAIRDNYDQIMEMMEKYPTAPLDMICSSVLFDTVKTSAVNEGKQIVRQKIQEKKQGSMASGNSTSPVTTTQTKANSFEEAFKQAMSDNK